MKSKEQIKLWINQSLTIEYEDGSVFYSHIVGEDEDFIYIQYPTNQNLERVQAVEGNVRIFFFSEQKDLMGCRASIAYRNGKIGLEKPTADSIWKVQRRLFFRVPAILQLTVKEASGDLKKYVTDDISGGGFSFFSKQKDFNVNDEIAGSISLKFDSAMKEVHYMGRIIRMNKDMHKGYRIAVAFTEMKESVRTEIIRYCYRRQLELRNLMVD